jgi:hypothetical protein
MHLICYCAMNAKTARRIACLLTRNANHPPAQIHHHRSLFVFAAAAAADAASECVCV